MKRPLRTREVTRILDDLRRIVRVLRVSSRASERRFGVTGAQLFALKAIAQVPALSLTELALRTRTHQSTVSVVVKRLVTARLVSRVASTQDGRRLELAVTSRGAAVLAKAPHAAQERLIEGIERLTEGHRDALAASLHRLTAAMQLDEDPPTMFFEDERAAPRQRKHQRQGKRPRLA